MPWTAYNASGTPTGLGGSSDYLHALTSSEIAITAATTATISRQHVVTGTSADYTVSLPAATGLGGKFLSLRFGPTLTQLSKVITIDTADTATIDGSDTRVCWAGESCTLYCDGTNWFKVAGKTIPMVCKASRSSTNQTLIAATTWTAIVMDGQDGTASNCPAAMYDSGNGRIKSVRSGWYAAIAYAYVTGASTFVYIGTGRNGSAPPSYAQSSAIGAGGVGAGAYTEQYYMPAGDYVQTFVFGDAGGTLTAAATSSPALSEVLEFPSW